MDIGENTERVLVNMGTADTPTRDADAIYVESPGGCTLRAGAS